MGPARDFDEGAHRYAKIRPHLEAVLGKRALELVEVPPSRQGERTDATSRPRDEKYTPPRETRLRAILRAPPYIRDLYEQGLISQKVAARLGPAAVEFQGRSWADYCRAPDGLQCHPEWVDQVERGVQILSKRGTARATTAQAVAALGPQGAPKGNDNAAKKEEKNKHNTIMFDSSRPSVEGTSSAYRKARLKRDAPEVAARLARGEFKNVAEAWRAAQEEGLVKVKRRADPVARAMRAVERAWKDMGPEDRERFAKELERAVGFGGRDWRAACLERARINVQRRIAHADFPHLERAPAARTPAKIGENRGLLLLPAVDRPVSFAQETLA
jgi:hypothetical protein